MQRGSIFLIILSVLFLAGCNGCNKSNSRPKPDVSNIKVEVHLLRFDRDFTEFRQKDFVAHQNEMRAKYGDFYDFYVSQFVIGPRLAGDTADRNQQAITDFVNDGYVHRLQDSIEFYFKDTKDVEAELSQSLKYFKYYFPKITIPQVVTVFSKFNTGAFTYGAETLGIGLDCYLGVQNADYDSAEIYQYVRRRMSKEYLPRNSMEVLYNLYFGKEEGERQTFINAMVDKGKKMYVLSMLLPDAPDSLLFVYTQPQLEWCQKSEKQIWQFFNDKDLLYKDDYMDQKRYLDEGPMSQGMPAEAPGNVGSWVGLQIVRKFMEQTDNKISLEDLVVKYDAGTIFKKSKYRP